MTLFLSSGETYKLNMEAFTSKEATDTLHIDFDEVLLKDGGIDYRTILRKGDIITLRDEHEDTQQLLEVRNVWEDKVKLREL